MRIYSGVDEASLDIPRDSLCPKSGRNASQHLALIAHALLYCRINI